MTARLPRLRSALDVFLSPVPDQPGLVLRDPLRYSEEVLLIPPAWVPALSCLDGDHTELDVQELMVRRGGGGLVFRHEVAEFVSMLKSRGFLETEEFYDLREKRHAEFRARPDRPPAHAGSAYPEDAERLRESFDARFPNESPREQATRETIVGLAAPHVSLEGGWDGYRAAYARVDPRWADKTFIILGTSHYGPPDTFGLTRKRFVTPLGAAEVDVDAVDFLAESAPEAVVMEDYCHAVEHSVEFQLIFLQYRLKSPVKIIPVVCGPFLETVGQGQSPERRKQLGKLFDALRELGLRRRGELVWVLGIDLAHMGRRYGDRVGVRAGEGPMKEIERRDRERLARVCDADAAGLLELVPEPDPLKWCGLTPLYTFLAAMQSARRIEGRVLEYGQWNIDPESVVTFSGMVFLEKSSDGQEPGS